MRKPKLEDYPFPNFMDGSEMPSQEFKWILTPEIFLKYENLRIVNPRDRIVYTVMIQEPKNEVILDISSYAGFSAGAKHVYGNLLFPRITYADLAKSHGKGIAFTLHIKEHGILQKIELNRELTKEEFEEDPNRYGDYQEKYLRYTHGFQNNKQVEKKAREFLRTHLLGFKMTIKDHT